MDNRRDLVIWAAGFLDGEGCISLSQSRRGKPTVYYSLQLTAFQNVRGPLDLLHRLFGGAIRTRASGWWWQMAGRPLLHALQELAPFMVVKKEQAETAIAFQQRKMPRGGKYADPKAARALDHADFLVMRELKKVRDSHLSE